MAIRCNWRDYGSIDNAYTFDNVGFLFKTAAIGYAVGYLRIDFSYNLSLALSLPYLLTQHSLLNCV